MIFHFFRENTGVFMVTVTAVPLDVIYHLSLPLHRSRAAHLVKFYHWICQQSYEDQQSLATASLPIPNRTTKRNFMFQPL